MKLIKSTIAAYKIPQKFKWGYNRERCHAEPRLSISRQRPLRTRFESLGMTQGKARVDDQSALIQIVIARYEAISELYRVVCKFSICLLVCVLTLISVWAKTGETAPKDIIYY